MGVAVDFRVGGILDTIHSGDKAIVWISFAFREIESFLRSGLTTLGRLRHPHEWLAPVAVVTLLDSLQQLERPVGTEHVVTRSFKVFNRPAEVAENASIRHVLAQLEHRHVIGIVCRITLDPASLLLDVLAPVGLLEPTHRLANQLHRVNRVAQLDREPFLLHRSPEELLAEVFGDGGMGGGVALALHQLAVVIILEDVHEVVDLAVRHRELPVHHEFVADLKMVLKHRDHRTEEGLQVGVQSLAINHRRNPVVLNQFETAKELVEHRDHPGGNRLLATDGLDNRTAVAVLVIAADLLRPLVDTLDELDHLQHRLAVAVGESKATLDRTKVTCGEVGEGLLSPDVDFSVTVVDDLLEAEASGLLVTVARANGPDVSKLLVHPEVEERRLADEVGVGRHLRTIDFQPVVPRLLVVGEGLLHSVDFLGIEEPGRVAIREPVVVGGKLVLDYALEHFVGSGGRGEFVSVAGVFEIGALTLGDIEVVEVETVATVVDGEVAQCAALHKLDGVVVILHRLAELDVLAVEAGRLLGDGDRVP